MPRPKQFSEKNTKAEILAAYNEQVALSQTSVTPSNTPSPAAYVSIKSADDPTKTIIDVRTKVLSDLHETAQAIEALIEQKQQLETDIKQKIADAERLHQIKIGAQTLQELRDQYRQEQLKWEQERKERTLQNEHEEKLRQLKRQQDDTQHQLEWEQAWDKEESRRSAKIQEREEALAQRERSFEESLAELDELRAKVANTPKELESAIRQAEQALRNELTKQFEHEKKFLNQQSEHERKLASQENTALKQTIAAQKIEIDQLTKQLTEATRQLNQIAIKIIETSGQKSLASGSIDSPTIIKPTKE